MSFHPPSSPSPPPPRSTLLRGCFTFWFLTWQRPQEWNLCGKKFVERKMSQRNESKLCCSFPFSSQPLFLSLSYQTVFLYTKEKKDIMEDVLNSFFVCFNRHRHWNGVFSLCITHCDKNISGIHSSWPPCPSLLHPIPTHPTQFTLKDLFCEVHMWLCEHYQHSDLCHYDVTMLWGIFVATICVRCRMFGYNSRIVDLGWKKRENPPCSKG